jgi:tetratricopeptide (TPR) repeat protein
MLAKVDMRAEIKQVEQIQFVSKADSDVLHLEGPGPNKLLIEAEKRLNSKDPAGAQKLAQQVLDEKTGDSGRALFILAEAATMTKNMKGAVDYFQQALSATQEPKVIAWSHIYLGRIFDLQEDRDSAVGHYKAALSASTDLPEAKAAAQRGLDKAYAPPEPQQNQGQNQTQN